MKKITKDINQNINKTIIFTELFNPKKLKYIIDNYENLKDEISIFSHNDNETTYRQITNYLNRSLNGKIKVSYSQASSRGGRYFAHQSVSLQGIARSVRQAISEEYYVDIDMKNAHPVILQYLCKKRGLDTPALNEYVIDREKILANTTNTQNIPKKYSTREGAKKLYLVLTNLGIDCPMSTEKELINIKTYTSHMESYKKEMHIIHENFAAAGGTDFTAFKETALKKGRKSNFQAAYMNSHLCDMENKILMILVNYFGNNPNTVLCFDGLMLPINNENPYNLRGAEQEIFDKLSINISLDIKPFNNVLRLPDMENIPQYQEMKIDTYNDYINISGKDKEFSEEIIDKWINNCLALLVWKGGHKIIRTQIEYDEYDDIIQELKFYEMTDIKSFLSDTNVYCNIPNVNFNIAFYNANCHYAASNAIWKDIRMQQYLCTHLCDYLSEKIKSNGIKKYDSVIYRPYLRDTEHNISKGVFNIFQGFSNLNRQPGIRREFEGSPLWIHMKNDFCNGNEAEFNHLLNFIADIIQDPSRVKRNAHIFISKQGCGKGLFAKLLINMLGGNNAIVVSNVARYFEKFNSMTSTKLLKIFEENAEDGSAFRNADRLKSEITGAKEDVEKKNQNAIQVKNCARYIFFSNHVENIVKIEAGDTRYTVHVISEEHKDNKKYFMPIANDLSDDDYIISAFHYFANRKYTYEDVSSPFENDFKLKQKIAGDKTSYKYIIDLVERTFCGKDFDNDKTLPPASDYCYRFPAADMNKEFRTLYGHSREDTLKNQLSQLGLEMVNMRYRTGESVKRCYVLYPPHLEKIFQKHLNNDKFKFNLAVQYEKEEIINKIPLQDELEAKEAQLKQMLIDAENLKNDIMRLRLKLLN